MTLIICTYLILSSYRIDFTKILKMKNAFYIYLLIVLILTGTSCQKEFSSSSPNTTIDSSSLLKTFSETYSTGVTSSTSVTFNVQYGANKQIIGLISTSNPADKFVFTFPLATKYTQDIFAGDTLVIHEDFYTNNNSFLDSTYQYNDTRDTSAEKYFYNANNQVVSMNEYQFTNGQSELINTINYSYNSDGDMVSATGTDLSTETYTYYTDAAYVTPLVTGILNINSFKKMHLPKTYSLSSNGILISTLNYTYIFDTKNRITFDKATANDGTSLTKAYTYF